MPRAPVQYTLQHSTPLPVLSEIPLRTKYRPFIGDLRYRYKYNTVQYSGQLSSVATIFLTHLSLSYLGRRKAGFNTTTQSHDPARPLNLELHKCAGMVSSEIKTLWLASYCQLITTLSRSAPRLMAVGGYCYYLLPVEISPQIGRTFPSLD